MLNEVGTGFGCCNGGIVGTLPSSWRAFIAPLNLTGN